MFLTHKLFVILDLKFLTVDVNALISASEGGAELVYSDPLCRRTESIDQTNKG